MKMSANAKLFSAATMLTCCIMGCSRADQISLPDTGGSPSTNGGTTSSETGGVSSSGGSSGGNSSNDLLLSQAPPGTVVVDETGTCGGTTCNDNEVCCLQTGTCFAKDKIQDCVVDKSTISDRALQEATQQNAKLCASNAGCASDEYCDNWETCLGAGYCVSRVNCGESSGSEYCGCNGVSYPNTQSACFAGVRIAGNGTCGKSQDIGSAGGEAPFIVTYCGSDAECGSGENCCAITGECYSASAPELCAYPPSGSNRACVDDTQCYQDGAFCAGDGCSGPGGCLSRYSFECTGLLNPVCGCDGQTYTNADCANASGVRVANTGACPDAGVAVDG